MKVDNGGPKGRIRAFYCTLWYGGNDGCLPLIFGTPEVVIMLAGAIPFVLHEFDWSFSFQAVMKSMTLPVAIDRNLVKLCACLQCLTDG